MGRTIQTKLTKKPRSIAGAELLALSKALTGLGKENFTNELEIWLEKHKDFLNERRINLFTHRRDDQLITLLSEIWLLFLPMRV